MGQGADRNWRKRLAPGFALGAALALAAAPEALALQKRDAKAVDALYQRSLDLTQQVTAAAANASAQLSGGGGEAALDCLEPLRDAAAQVSDQLIDVRDVASLAASLQRGPDRRRGAAATRRAAASALAVLEVEGKQVSRTASLCASQPGVQQLAKDELQLIDDATAALKQLQGRSWSGSKSH
jgi:hypothetical protein